MVDFIKLRESMPCGVRSDIAESALAKWKSSVRSADESADDQSIYILDVIGEDWFGGVSSDWVAGKLRQAGPTTPVTVYVNSPGGDMWEGLAIHSLLKDHKAPVTVKVLGLAASAASVITMAADNVLMARSSFLMIHNAWMIAAGDRQAFRELSEWLEPFDWAMSDIYSQRSDLDQGEVAKMMDSETWIGASKAIDQGFADDILGEEAVTEADGEGDEITAHAALQRIEKGLAKAGMTRTERRGLIKQFTAGKPSAAAGQDTPGAVETLNDINQSIHSLRGVFDGLRQAT